MKTATYKVTAVTTRYADAAGSISQPGDCAVVERAGTERQLVMRCPDGCGEILSINLDRRSGPAWRLYFRCETWSLFPSIDKPSGCRSHFILWRGHVLWCGPYDSESGAPEIPEIGRDRILSVIGDQPMRFVEVADRLDAIPWDVLSLCRNLAHQGSLEEGLGKLRGSFWKKA